MVQPGRRLEGIERTLIRRIFDAAPPGAINLGLGQPEVLGQENAPAGAVILRELDHTQKSFQVVP